MVEKRVGGGVAALQYSAIAVVAFTALVALGGWVSGALVFSTVDPGYTPMAPVTAIVFLLLSGGLLFRARVARPRGTRGILALTGTICFVMLLELSDIVGGLPVSPERLFLPPGTVEMMPSGRMSPVTMVAFVGISVAVALCESRAPRLRAAAIHLALAVASGAFVLLAGYVYDAPLLYGGQVLPVALPTSVCLLLLGLVISLFGLGVWPYALFVGDSIRAQLTRALVPIALVPMLAVSLLDAAIIRMGQPQSPVLRATAIILAFMLVTWVVLRAATRIGERIETAEQALVQNRALLHSVINGTSDAVYVKDTAGRYLLFNQAAEAVTGKSKAEVIGKDDTFLFPAEQAEAVMAGDRAVMFGGVPKTYEEQVNAADGTLRHYSSSKGPIFATDGSLAGLFGIARDITESWRLQADLRERTADLEQSNRDLQEFAYVASHDLKEPLRMVASYTQLLQLRYQGKLDSDADEFIGYAVEGAMRMDRLIDELLEFARAGTRGLPLSACDLDAVIEEALLNLAPAISESHAVVTHGDMPTAWCDPVQIGRVFQNLIANAIKFRDEKQPIIHVGVQETEREWRISVADNGAGIAPEYSEQIFTIFERLHSTVDHPGTGMGLAICRRIIERHHGRIWVEPGAAGGSTFWFTLKRDHAVGSQY